MVSGGIAHGAQSQLIVVEGNMTAVRCRDYILRPVAVPLVQQRQLILQQDNTRPEREIKVKGQKLGTVPSFNYLGAVVSNQRFFQRLQKPVQLLQS